MKKVHIISILMVIILLSGCTLQKTNSNASIINEFNGLLGTEIQVIADFVAKNIQYLNKDEATLMVIRFEEEQKDYLKKFEEKFYDLQKVSDALKEEATKCGYKIETAEGMYFPIIDYSFYKQFSPYVSDYLKAYIDILAVESEKVPAKDAALMITFEEIVGRALKQEEFLEKYPDSSKSGVIKELYNKYKTFTYYGLNNTPLFDYETGKINEDARLAYTKATKEDNNSKYLKSLRLFLEVLAKNNFTLNDIVIEYRNKIN